MKLNKVVNYFKSKSVVDFVYLVMMILIVTIIKDMLMSMYRKRKDTNWFNNKQKKVDEKFTTPGQPTMVCPDTITQNSTVCEKLKFLLCDDNFEKVRRLIGGVTVRETDGFNLDSGGGNIFTTGGHIITTVTHDLPSTYNDDDTPENKGHIITGEGRIQTRIIDLEFIRGRNTADETIDIEIQQPIKLEVIKGEDISIQHEDGTGDNVHIKLYGRLKVMDDNWDTRDTRNIQSYTIKTTDIGHLGHLNMYGDKDVHLAYFRNQKCNDYGQLVSKSAGGDKYFSLAGSSCSS